MVIIFCIFPQYIEFHQFLLSDLLFSYFIFLGIYLNEKYKNFNNLNFIKYLEPLVFGVALLIRKQSIFWIFAYFIFHLIKKEFDLRYVAFYFLPSFVFFTIFRTNPVGNISNQAGEWSDFKFPDLDTIIFTFKEIGYIVTRFPNNISSIVGMFFLLFIFYMFIKEKNLISLFSSYAIFHFFIYTIYVQRFWMPIIGPLIIYTTYYLKFILRQQKLILINYNFNFCNSILDNINSRFYF